MIKNYFITALRSILKNRIYSLINVVGLSLGIGVSLLIFLFVSHELSFDKFHRDADRIYRMFGRVNYGGQFIQMTAMSSQFGPMLMESNAGVQNYVRVRNPGRVLMKAD